MRRPSQIRRKSLAVQVADSIRKMIMSGALRQGEALRQEQIANQLGVSRIPVREALQLLEAEGLITNKPYKGAIVTKLSEAEIREYFDIRAVLESDLIAEAIDHMTAEDISIARGYLHKMTTASPLEWGKLNWEFHAQLCKPAGKLITLEFIKRIHDNLDRLVRLQLSIADPSLEHANQEHELLLKLCETGQKEKTVSLLKEHIAKTRDDLLDHMKDHP